MLDRNVVNKVNASTSGAKMPRAEWDVVGHVEIPVPPFGQQIRVADCLDERTAAIDSVITGKQKHLALLEERRQALVTQAATNGMDPAAPMKESGIDPSARLSVVRSASCQQQAADGCAVHLSSDWRVISRSGSKDARTMPHLNEYACLGYCWPFSGTHGHIRHCHCGRLP